MMRDFPLQAWSYTASTGITLRGLESPRTGKPVVHFIHGTGFNGLVYWPMLRQLLSHVDLVLTDAQGHGDSDIGTRFLGWVANATMIREALQQRRAQWGDVPLIGMGHSFGAIVTALIAQQSPQLFDRLLLLDPIFLPPAHAAASAIIARFGLMQYTPMTRRARQRRAHWPDRGTAHQSLHQRGVFRGWHDEAFAAYVQHALHERDDGVHLRTPPWFEAQVFGGYSPAILRALRQLRTPCHVIRGDSTFPYVKSGLQRLCTRNAQVTQEVMPGDHCFMQQFPQQAAERVLRHLVGATLAVKS